MLSERLSPLLALMRLVAVFRPAEPPPSFSPEALRQMDPAAPPVFSAAMRLERARLEARGEWPC